MRNRWSALPAALVLILGACAASDSEVVEEAEPTTAPSVATTISTPTSTTVSHSTTTAPLPAPSLDLTEYLATSGDIAALALIDIVRADSDPFQMLAAYGRWATALATLNPPGGYEDHHNQWLTIVEGQWAAFDDLLASDDPQAALGDFMETMAEQTFALEALAQSEGQLITEILQEREGDPVAEYFVARANLTSDEGVAATFDELFTALGGLLDDPEGSIQAMASLLEATKPLMGQWDDLEPPPRLEDLHERQMETWKQTVEVFASLVDALESDEPPPPPATLTLQDLSDEAPLLNAEWALSEAAALRGELSSGFEGRWHRDNYGVGHEQLFCAGSRETVECRFLSHSFADPASVGVGGFVGSLVDADACLPYMDDVCSTATAISQGMSSYSSSPGEQPLLVPVTLAVLPDGSMALSWDEHPTIADGEFHCPWFREYATAFATDPTCTPEPWKARS